MKMPYYSKRKLLAGRYEGRYIRMLSIYFFGGGILIDQIANRLPRISFFKD